MSCIRNFAGDVVYRTTMPQQPADHFVQCLGANADLVLDGLGFPDELVDFLFIKYQASTDIDSFLRQTIPPLVHAEAVMWFQLINIPPDCPRRIRLVPVRPPTAAAAQ